MIFDNLDAIQLYHKKFKDVDCTDWEIDHDTGSIAYVIIPYDNGGSVRYINRTIVVQECIDWLKDNSSDEWFFDFEKNGIVFYFKKYNDALLFKLAYV